MWSTLLALEPPQWPPRSPYEAIISSPTGRRKLQQRQNRTSPSPLPVKKSATITKLRPDRTVDYEPPMEGEEEEEDEETLRLQLRALEAKLKLKKLQNKKAKVAALESGSDVENEASGATRSVSRATSVLSSRRGNRTEGTSLARSKSSGDIQVPLSPNKQRIIAQEQRSPGRVLLGIDKGLSAKHVSLRRAPSLRTTSATNDDPFGPTLRSIESRAGDRLNSALNGDGGRTSLKSFNERIAESREREKSGRERQEKAAKFQRQRSKGFGIQQHDLDTFKAAAAADAQRSDSQQEHLKNERGFTRAEVLNAVNRPAGGLIQRTESIQSKTQRTTSSSGLPSIEPSARPKSVASSYATSTAERSIRRDSVSLSNDSSQPDTPGDPALFEGFSSTNLSRRILPHSFLSRTLESKHPVLIPALLRDVTAPEFSLPTSLEDKDLVVFGIIASKSDPIAHKDTHKAQNQSTKDLTSTEEADESKANVKGKYMAFTLTDLKWTLDLYLFDTAFTRHRKLIPGTLIAVLNPNIMPPPPGRTDTGRWSLCLNSSDDTILEIGTSKDLSWCKATKKDGQRCPAWVDCRKTDFCEFHVDRNVERTRRGRMEVQGMSAPFAPGGKSVGRHDFFGSTARRRGQGGNGERDDGLLREGRQYDRGVHSTYFITPHMGGRSAANLLDADEDGGGRGSREERARRALAEREKENEIAKKLGEGGNGAGAEYLRLRQPDGRSVPARDIGQMRETRDAGETAPDVEALGLKRNRAADVLLSPLKRKHSSAAGGGGTAKKRTRFVTAKGIREAGRESLGGAVGTVTRKAVGRRDYGDDELDIY